MSTLDLAGLEDAGSGRVDRLERRAASTPPPVDRQQWPISGFAVGTRPRAGQQDSGAERAANAARLGDPLRVASPAVGNPGGCGSFSRNLLSGGQLDPCRANR